MMVHASNLQATGGVRHGFFTRRGGVSIGQLASLNCGYSGGDPEDVVARNRALAMEALGCPHESLQTVRQVHGIEVLVVRRAESGRPLVEADALVTAEPGVTLGVLSADCAPVLIADPVAGVIGAAHAGWRSSLGGVVEAMVRAMIELGAAPSRLVAAVGPCIAAASYEVGPDMRDLFLAGDPPSAGLFTPLEGSDRLRFDLKAHVLSRLARAGVPDRMALIEDTFEDEERFFSARRARRRGEERFGLLLSAIALVR